MARFDGQASVETAELIGSWDGTELPTGHPLDGLLERLGWQGKRFKSEERVYPLIFRSGVAIDPAFCPSASRCACRASREAPRCGPDSLSFAPLCGVRSVGTPRPVEFRGCLSTAMIHDCQPIIDHFRRIDATRLLGLMQARSQAPFFFMLTLAE